MDYIVKVAIYEGGEVGYCPALDFDFDRKYYERTVEEDCRIGIYRLILYLMTHAAIKKYFAKRGWKTEVVPFIPVEYSDEEVKKMAEGIYPTDKKRVEKIIHIKFHIPDD